MNKQMVLAYQLRKALELLTQTAALPEEEAMEIADFYPEWEPGKKYLKTVIVKYGVNKYGETQLYTVISDHTSQEDWTPDKATSLFKIVGYTEDGTPIWSQPILYDDAWEIGDIVEYDGQLWQCTDGNVSGLYGMRNTFAPDVWGWSLAGK